MASSSSSFRFPRDLSGDNTTGAYYRSPFAEDADELNRTSQTRQHQQQPYRHHQQHQEQHQQQEQHQHQHQHQQQGQQQAETGELKTCRICFDTTTGLFDPELGRLLSPCRCRGSSKYVHEECLNQWRRLSANAKSYYECTTCGYRYKFRRLTFSRWVGSNTFQLTITSLILLLTVYVLGFIADPIINIYFTYPTLPSPPPGLRSSDDSIGGFLPKPSPGSLTEHMLKGLTSLGLLGFVKVLYIIGPGSWWNLRQSGLFGNTGGRPGGGSGRDRLGQLGWIVILVGVLNFFVWVWKKVSVWTRRWLDKAMEEIMDVDEDPNTSGGR